MYTIRDALDIYRKLSFADRMLFYSILSRDTVTDRKDTQECMNEARFSEGEVCPYCDSRHAVRNGKRPDGTQRYLCRDCGRSFTVKTASLISGTRKPVASWLKYLECMLSRMTLKESARVCGISPATSFLWRHKILSVLTQAASRTALYGTVEADETYFNVSYKGKHGENSGFTMPRAPHRRGNDVHTKGLSEEMVCVLCAVNLSGLPVTAAGKTGKVSSSIVEKVFSGRIMSGSELCTDHEKAYRKFAEASGIRLIQTGTGCRTEGVYGIQRINSYHSRLKGFLSRFHGVATKYLNSYLAWHDIMFCSGRDRNELSELLVRMLYAAKTTLRCSDIPDRKAFPYEEGGASLCC